MLATLSKTARATPLYYTYREFVKWREARRWQAAGRSGPPPHRVKARIVNHYAREFGLHTLIETGTNLGDMVLAGLGNYSRIISIELDPVLCRMAQRRFRKNPNVEILRGDSGMLLAEVVASLTGPAVFWLDGHYSGGLTARGDSDTPVVKEVGHILDGKEAGHVVLIDDARCFSGADGFPQLDDISALIKARRPQWNTYVSADIIRAHAPLRI